MDKGNVKNVLLGVCAFGALITVYPWLQLLGRHNDEGWLLRAHHSIDYMQQTLRAHAETPFLSEREVQSLQKDLENAQKLHYDNQQPSWPEKVLKMKPILCPRCQMNSVRVHVD